MMYRFTGLCVLLCATSALASEAVIADPAATAACAKASGLETPSLSAPIRFSDRMGRTALILSGFRPGGLKTRPETMLCLYDRHANWAETRDMGPWSKLPRR